MQTTLRSIGMSFSRDGKYLLLIGGVPDFTISIYDIEAQAFFKTPLTKLPFKHSQLRCDGVQFNPRCSEEFCILSDTKIYFYTIKQAFMQVEGTVAATSEMDNESNFALQESFRFEVKEFSASDIPCPPNDDAPVVFSGLKWDMWNRVHLCTNKPYVYQITSRDTPSVEHTLDCGAVPLTVLHTQKNLIVSTEEGMLTWYRVEQPYENQDGTVDNTMCMNITDAVD